MTPMKTYDGKAYKCMKPSYVKASSFKSTNNQDIT